VRLQNRRAFFTPNALAASGRCSLRYHSSKAARFKGFGDGGANDEID
jgi:hypothetical protein